MKKVTIQALMVVLAIPVMLPFLWMFSTSLKPLPEVNQYPPVWISENMTLDPYADMFSFLPFATYTLNSLFVAFLATALTLVFGGLAGFALSRFRFRGKEVLLMIFLLSQMLPGASVIIPLFQLLRLLGLYDSLLGLSLVHTSILLPFVIWLLYGFFNTVPREVEDAALIDGCSPIGALRRVILPLILPGLGATALFAFLGSWNEFFFALLLTTSDSVRTIPVGIGLFVGEYQDVWNQMSAAAVLFSVPPLVLFMMMRKTFVKGLSAGAIR
ncbi:MAG TPA: carbohydrate ABC transporter permease [Rhodothermales bacterium]|nr:carbohydrate ABC transporter permease [Rhodothermales bacterium]